MLGISFLYAIWHSPLVRSQLTYEDVDFTVLIATSVLGDLIANCPPAEACRDAFARMAKATITMVEKSTGFGSASTLSSQPLNVPRGNYIIERDAIAGDQAERATHQTNMPHFDMDLKALFSKEEIASRPLAQQFKLHTAGRRPQDASSSAVQQPPQQQQQQQQPPSSFHPTNTSPSHLLQSPTALSTATSNTTTAATFPQPGPNQLQPFTTTYATLPAHPSFDLSLEPEMSFLDATFPASSADPWAGGGGGWSDWDTMGLGFATGGTGQQEADGGWGPGGGGGWDMFDGFFFGEGGGGFG